MRQRSPVGRRSRPAARGLVVAAVLLLLVLLAQGAFLKAGTAYVAPGCLDLTLALADIGATVAAGASYKFSVTLPCAAGSNNVGSWGAPDYGCYDAGASTPIVPILVVAKPTTVTISADKATCSLGASPPQRPTLTAGAAAAASVRPLLQLGWHNATGPTADVLKVTITNVDFDGGHLRAGVRAYNLAALTLTSVDILNAANADVPAALYVADTPTAYKCSTAVRCKVSGSRNSPPGYFVPFPPAGGAIGIAAAAKGAPFSASFVDFKDNQHTNFGGVFAITKQSPLPLSVKFTSCLFSGNTAALCSVGATVRADPGPGNTPGAPLTLSFKGSSWAPAGNLGTTPSAQLDAGLVCGVYASLTPWDPSKATKVPGLPTYTLPAPFLVPSASLAPYQSALSVVLPSGFTAEFLIVDGFQLLGG